MTDSPEETGTRLRKNPRRGAAPLTFSDKPTADHANDSVKSGEPHCEQSSGHEDSTDGARFADESLNSKKLKPCDKSVCAKAAMKPTCFALASDKCCIDGWTSRWYHISIGEHYCNDCFDNFYRSTKEGYDAFSRWKRLWSLNGITEANIKMFLVDQYLPFWIQCVACDKWRQMPKETDVTPDLIRGFNCRLAVAKTSENVADPCAEPEDPRVQESMEPQWINVLLAPPYMMSSPAAPFLVNYFHDGVGMSACGNMKDIQKKKSPSNGDADGSDCSEGENDPSSAAGSKSKTKSGKTVLPSVPGVPSYFQPFDQPGFRQLALSLPPNQMTDDEQIQFPQYAEEQQMYLAVRNIVLALWTLNQKEALTVEKCISHLICRGLVRVRCIQELPSIVHYLTRKAYINTGIFSGSLHGIIAPGTFRKNVIIVGAGPAGLAAARQLTNLGCQVTVLEARDRIGGRVCDDFSLGQCVAKGAQIINGATNNPITLLCHQMDNQLVEISDICPLLTNSGKIMNPEVDKYMDFHFNSLLENVHLWRTKATREDTSLLGKIKEMHQQFVDETQLDFSKDEEQVLQFHYAYLEQACGAPLDSISAINWDQNETFSQFGGAVCLVPGGYSKVIQRLAKGIDIRFNTQVTSVDYSGDRLNVVTFGGSELVSDYLIVTIPLYLLKKEVIKFNPPLPDAKIAAINKMGAGVIEKVVLQFDHRFWSRKTGNADIFGRVPDSPSTRGLFTVFYDLTVRCKRKDQPDGEALLVTFLSGNSAKLVRSKSDKEIVDMCIAALKQLFPEEEVTEPKSYFVTRWQDDPYAGMSYSYLPVGSTGFLYEDIAAPVSNKVFFAGEATSRCFPQTVSGAYMTGLTEACRILDLEEDAQQNVADSGGTVASESDMLADG